MKEHLISPLLVLAFQCTMIAAILPIRLDIKVYPIPPQSGHSYEEHEPPHYEVVQERADPEPPTTAPPSTHSYGTETTPPHQYSSDSTTSELPTYKDLAPIKHKNEDVMDPKAAKEAIMAALKAVELKDRRTLPEEDIYSRNVVRDRIQDIVYGPPPKMKPFKWYKDAPPKKVAPGIYEYYNYPEKSYPVYEKNPKKHGIVEYHTPDTTHLVGGHSEYPGIVYKKYKKPVHFEINIPTVTVPEVPEWARN